ncbi:hypothetical protein GCM10017786_08160 [Amycolatopsis deserti]|uniref:Uncharacterized protein n=1 Tax=Amycolatopsis deserti TaxID=185696 RepID=A0ABQ3IEA3_9PSEU|nr:hypothetical protein [Amycolatopsis deserti]GHE80416.1 hypothetical protein GCM10017786_08160 [Amycolatopsis deserti]
MPDNAVAHVRSFLAARRDAVAARVAAQPGEWMSIPAWSRWFRVAYRLLRRDLTEPAPPRER